MRNCETGRRPKEGLDYVDWDTDVFMDRDIVRLMDAKGAEGFVIYFYLAQMARKYKGYYFAWTREDAAITAKLIGGGVESRTVLDTVGECLRLGLFDRTLFERDGILTSRRIQRHYLRATEKRRHAFIKDEYNLLLDEEFQDAGAARTGRDPEMDCSALERSSLEARSGGGEMARRDALPGADGALETGGGVAAAARVQAEGATEAAAGGVAATRVQAEGATEAAAGGVAAAVRMQAEGAVEAAGGVAAARVQGDGATEAAAGGVAAARVQADGAVLRGPVVCASEQAGSDGKMADTDREGGIPTQRTVSDGQTSGVETRTEGHAVTGEGNYFSANGTFYPQKCNKRKEEKIKENKTKANESVCARARGENGRQSKQNRTAPEGERRSGAPTPPERVYRTDHVSAQPSLEEVLAFGKSRGWGESSCRRFFDVYNVTGWLDARGQPIRSWKQKMIFWEQDVALSGWRQNGGGATRSWSALQGHMPGALQAAQESAPDQTREQAREKAREKEKMDRMRRMYGMMTEPQSDRGASAAGGSQGDLRA